MYDTYTEKHHIVPRCLGGGDCIDNIVRLPPRDHFFAHMLLCRIHGTRGLWFALITMSSKNGKSAIGYKANSRTYSRARLEYSNSLIEDHPMRGVKLSMERRLQISNTSPRLSGELHPMYGRKHSYETRIKMSKSSKRIGGKDHPMYGYRHSEDARKEMSESRSGTKNPRADKTEHMFTHNSGEIFIGNRVDFCNMSGLASCDVSRLVNGKYKKSKGWVYNGTA